MLCGVVTGCTHHHPPVWTLHHSSYRLSKRSEERHGGDIQSIFLLLLLLLLVFTLLQDPFKQPVDDSRIDGLVHVHLYLLDLLLFLSAPFSSLVFNYHLPRTGC